MVRVTLILTLRCRRPVLCVYYCVSVFWSIRIQCGCVDLPGMWSWSRDCLKTH